MARRRFVQTRLASCGHGLALTTSATPAALSPPGDAPMSLCRRVIIVAAFAVVSFPARSTIDQALTGVAERAAGPTSYTGAGAASCTHALFVYPRYDTGNRPYSVAIGDLDGVNGPDLAVANATSDVPVVNVLARFFGFLRFSSVSAQDHRESGISTPEALMGQRGPRQCHRVPR